MQPKTPETIIGTNKIVMIVEIKMNIKTYYDKYIDQTKPHGITQETISPESQTCNHKTNSKPKR